MDILSALIPDAHDERNVIAPALAKYGERVLRFCADAGILIYLLRDGELYREASPELQRLGIDVDLWPVPPAGLFVCSEKRAYLRSRSPMTAAHEFAHAFDCALGGGVYFSGTSADVRKAFAATRNFVTPYAASSLDEYWAECVRSWVGVNDPNSCWPRVSRARLKRLDPTMHAILADVFARFDDGDPA